MPDNLYTSAIHIPPCFHEQSSVGDAEAQVPGPLGQHTEDGAQHWVDHNHLCVHDCTAHKRDAEKCRTGVLEHLDPPIVIHEEDGDEAAEGAEHRDTQENKSEEEMFILV